MLTSLGSFDDLDGCLGRLCHGRHLCQDVNATVVVVERAPVVRVGGRRAVAGRLGSGEEELAALVVMSRHGGAHFEGLLIVVELTEWCSSEVCQES